MAANDLVAFKEQLDVGEAELRAALPDKAAFERFRRATMTAVQNEPKLLQADRKSLFLALTKCANDGFTPDGREAAIVPFKDKTKGNVAVYLPMVQGIVGRLRASGAVTAIWARLVYQKELDEGRFKVVEGTDRRIEHDPILTGDRGDIVLVYAVAQLPGGGVEFDWMPLDDLAKVEAISRSATGPWKGPFRGEMMKKTIIRRLAKLLNLPIEVRAVVERDDSDLYDLDLAAAPATTGMKGLREKLGPKGLAAVIPVSEAPEGAAEPSELDVLMEKIATAADQGEARAIYEGAEASGDWSSKELDAALAWVDQCWPEEKP